jgi:hypothetical protein
MKGCGPIRPRCSFGARGMPVGAESWTRLSRGIGRRNYRVRVVASLAIPSTASTSSTKSTKSSPPGRLLPPTSHLTRRLLDSQQELLGLQRGERVGADGRRRSERNRRSVNHGGRDPVGVSRDSSGVVRSTVPRSARDLVHSTVSWKSFENPLDGHPQKHGR